MGAEWLLRVELRQFYILCFDRPRQIHKTHYDNFFEVFAKFTF